MELENFVALIVGLFTVGAKSIWQISQALLADRGATLATQCGKFRWQY